MNTHHQLHIADARDMSALADASVQLVVTSPPYPMIEMWDEAFAAMDPGIGSALAENDGRLAFERMHVALDHVWSECFRVLRPGGLACINIGDATRTMGGDFRLYPNHARILSSMMAIGFDVLPDILWRKPTNAPNKFMGSGMLPAGAYVTYEHEYILVARKGSKRVFRTEADKAVRRKSAFFWEERNLWFSDLWVDLLGTQQQLDTGRNRSAAYPFELPYRLINMFSAYGDTVLDPFVGTGTTMAAALTAGRSSIGIDRLEALADVVETTMRHASLGAVDVARARLERHRAFVAERMGAGKAMKHHNEPHDLPVVTAQEQQMTIMVPTTLEGSKEQGYLALHEVLAAH